VLLSHAIDLTGLVSVSVLVS